MHLQYRTNVYGCHNENCTCGIRCASCNTNFVEHELMVCDECIQKGNAQCDECSSYADRLYPLNNKKICLDCYRYKTDSAYRDREYCLDCKLYNTYIDSTTGLCPSCEAIRRFGDNHTEHHPLGTCRDCNNYRPVNEDGICQFCFTHKEIVHSYPVCTMCGAASDVDPCLNCRADTKICGNCRLPFSPTYNGQGICEACFKQCEGCHTYYKPEKRTSILCEKCEHLKNKYICNSCMNISTALDASGRCMSCSKSKTHYCSNCKAALVKKPQDVCEECKILINGRICPNCKENTIGYEEYLCRSCLYATTPTNTTRLPVSMETIKKRDSLFKPWIR